MKSYISLDFISQIYLGMLVFATVPSENNNRYSIDMKINAIDIRVGNLLEHNGKLWMVLKTMHTQPGKGGAYMQVEMKDIRERTKTNVRFRSVESVERVQLQQRNHQFIYAKGDELEFMDSESFETLTLNSDLLGDDLPFLEDNMKVVIDFYNDAPISVVLPELVICRVSECEPVVKGQTATSSYKPALLHNGVRVMVPPFIGVDDRVVVKVATREYMERAK